ncbi:Hypothetical Protein FCC1311_051312 [Hondaea fermentalgiana]|uniref:Uncharacterized protein n=1 Tax=Hondaea fermentalgiana TaxID=2315210 RepID=A0A2R5GD43_9STRA|nr:Hypothetical Protein FCC1311_051312 [Hondaea fermentalgiana]|eukprot:GBG28910.1 Hypothetical Protein FCC1311_051312 [Hondaea fermentalgiana]
MAGRREDSRGLGQEWRGWDLDDTDEHVVPTAETHAKIADAEKNHADTHHQKSKKKKNNRKKDNIAANKLPNYNIDVTDQLVLDDEKGIVITQADIDAALQELGLEEGIIASVEVDPRDAQRSPLSWFDDFELNSDDRFLIAAEQAGWRAWLLAEEKRELEEWLALSEDVPDPEKTAPSLLRLEMRLASSFAPLWLKDGTNDQADTEIAFPPPSPSERAVEWPSGLLKWWLSPANESRRRRFLDVEARHACVSDFVRTQAEKYEIGAVEPADADSSDRETRQRWRDFRTWYFSSDATIGRQQFLTAEVNRLAQAWETEWAKWVRFAHDRQLLDAATKALLGDKPLRWALVSAFVDDLTPVTEELVLRETWGESLTWANMSEEERRTEANVALYDQIVRSIAESENILPQAKRHARHSENHNHDVDTSPEDVDFESDPDESSDDDSFLSDGDEDDDMGPERLNEEHLEIFMMWFPGNAQVRGNFLRREIQCAAADFVRDRPLFAGAISNNVSDPSTEKETDVLRRKMSVSAGVWSDKRMGEQRNSILSEASALQELRDALSNSGKFSVLDVDEDDGAFPSDLESATESELDEATSFKDMTNGSLEDSISCRRQDLDDAKRDLEEARRLYEEICNKCDASEAARLARVGQEFDEASDNVRRRSVRKARRVSRILDAHERLVKLEALQEECDAEVDVLRLEHRASTVAERHSIAVIRRMCELHMKTVEEAHRQAQEKLLEALRSEAAEGESTGESSKSSFGALHRNNTMLERSEKRLLATKQLAKLLGDMDNIENEIPQRVVRPSIRKRSIFESMHKVSQACVGSQRAILKLRQGTSLLKDELCKELQATAGASFVGADPISDPTMNSFKTWYSENKNVRMKYLQNRMTKLDNYRTAMLERGQGRRLIGRGIFAPEEDLEVPPVDAAAMRRIKLKRLYGLFRPEELEADDEAMRRAEMQGQEALEHELQGLMDQERRGMRKNLMREIAREVLEAFHRKHFDMEEVTTSVLGSIRFAGAVRPQAMELIDQARFTNGSGLENGDEEYERDLERYEAEREWRAKEEERRKAELRLMRAEDEELKKFYTRERRALLMAEAEAELNARALLERDEDRERREHPSGLCWRELRDLDRREMEREDYESRQRWQEIEAHEAAEALRIQEEANRQLELQLAEEEELWRNLEERRRVAQQDALVSCRELHEMAEEDLRSSYYNRIWEEERHRLARLRWMESVAFAKFDPFFKTSAGASSARLYANVKANGDGVGGDDDDDDDKEEKELTDSNDACFVDERAEMDHAGGKRKKRDKKGREKLDAPTIPSRRDRHETFRLSSLLNVVE